MSTVTLTSLAILKVNIDQGTDYLDYLRPFVLQALFDDQPEVVSDREVAALIRHKFGLEIPARTIQIVLQRLVKADSLKRDHGIYILRNITNPGIAMVQGRAQSQIKATAAALMEYAHKHSQVEFDENRATEAICAFLSKFNVSCLRAYLRGTAIPDNTDSNDTDIILVSKYVMHVRETNNDLFEKFMIFVQGHMLANALLCPDLKSASTYKKTTFYLDTPLLVQLLGLEGESRKRAADELMLLLSHLGGRVAMFAHTREELGRVLDWAAAWVDAPKGHGRIIQEARRKGRTRSDLILLANDAEDMLEKAGVKLHPTPAYITKYQIDESGFEDILDDGVMYLNPRAKEYDINSVRSIYVLRRGAIPLSVEKSKAILVTSNTSFAKAAWQYGRKIEASREVSSVISDFSLANLAWLKSPMGAPSLPMVEVMAFAYAAAQPSTALMSRFLSEIENLRSSGAISERNHELLRSSPSVYDELVSMTLGDDTALTESGVREILHRVEEEIKAESEVKLAEEKSVHMDTQKKLRDAQAELRGSKELHQRREENLYWRCSRIAKYISGALVILAFIPFVFVVVGQGNYWIDLATNDPIILVGNWMGVLFCLLSAAFGTTFLGLHGRFQRWISGRLWQWLADKSPIEDEDNELA